MHVDNSMYPSACQFNETHFRIILTFYALIISYLILLIIQVFLNCT